MEYRVDTQGDRAVIRIQGVLTFDDHETFKNVVGDITSHEAPQIELNLSETKMIDSAGIGMLLLANDKAKKCGKTLRLGGVDGHVSKVIELAKVDQLIPIV